MRTQWQEQRRRILQAPVGCGMKRYTVWQCNDFCCEQKPYTDKWWNVSTAPGNYESYRTWRQALAVVA